MAPTEDEIAAAVAYLIQLRPTTKRPMYSSYSLKHRAESWGRYNGREPYVSNGALIAAAVRLQLPIFPHGINAEIGVSRSDVDALTKKREAQRGTAINNG